MRKTTPIKTGKMRGRLWLMKRTGESQKKGCNSRKNKTYRISKIVAALSTFSTRFSIQKMQLVCS
jgi:hypothetical protein